jgi:Uma2 family endonuclease
MSVITQTNLATVAQPLLTLRNITWQTYENLLADLDEQSGVHLTFDQGVLEIMTLTPEHESINRYLSSLIDLLVDELGKDVHPVGSATFKRADVERGFEPDSSFYFSQATQMRGKKRIDLRVDPAPELVIEIDISHGSLDKLSIFAQFGISEIWRYDGANIHIYHLVDEAYEEHSQSRIFPKLTDDKIEKFLTNSQTMTRQELKQWLRQNLQR